VKQTQTLFLHGGPGASAIPERELYGNSLPLIWWDQPRAEVLFAKPYQALLDDAAIQAETLIGGGAHKVNLVAHSFGAHLALHLAVLMPEKIGSIALIAPVFDVSDAIARLGEHVLPMAADPHRLIEALEQNRLQPNRFETFRTLVEEIWDVPGIPDVYWSPASGVRKKWFLEVIAREAWVDFNTFIVILKDFWETKPMNVKTTVAGPVNFVFGTHDVLVDATQEARNWLRYFPDATISQLDAGHYPHLEAPPELWLVTRS
jgi:pimeloyl-ACP methyl ester carboxylesterase